MTISYITGNLLDSDERFVAHGCNCEGKFGAGFAYYTAQMHPEVEVAYQAAITAKQFVGGTCQPVQCDTGRVFFNLGTQQAPGRDGNYWFVLLSFGNLVQWCIRNAVYRVAIPRIGCGIAGLEWDAVEYVINGVLGQSPNAPEVVVYTLPHEAHLFDVIDVESTEVV